MFKAELKTQLIIDENGQFSFQIVNVLTGNIVFSPSVSWTTKEEALTASEKTYQMLLKNWPGAMVFKLMNGNVGLIANQEDVEVPRREILVRIVVHKTTGKFGTAVTTQDGTVLVDPDRWFDTQAEALAYAREDGLRVRVKEEAAKRGLGDITFVELPTNTPDFEQMECERGQSKLSIYQNIPPNFDYRLN